MGADVKVSDLLPILVDLQNAVATIAGQSGVYSGHLGELVSRAGRSLDALLQEEEGTDDA